MGSHNKDHDSCISHKLIITAVVCSLVFSHLIGIFQVCLGVMDTVILLVHLCVLVWVLFGVLSIICITSFSYYFHLKYQETTHFPYNTITFQKYFYFSEFSDFQVSLNTTLILHLFHFYSCSLLGGVGGK